MPQYLQTRKQTQPLVVALGERLKPDQVFVVVEGHVVKCKSLMAAVDMCFKVIYVLWTDFAWQCANTWDALQKIVYGLGEGKGKAMTSPSTRTLRSYLAQ